ncbi:PREDICTED: uncharacterized protein LOC104565074 [Tinamus guttatus]|uniref:uncharacterized protein LOC104565074 n=1 Tax=Tinamus guttatus TaxID=94827 RepID=UPI00052EC88B|nr:PREDICTED: uncharacterized protein LOC104565074 [Tinamus guttatus]
MWLLQVFLAAAALCSHGAAQKLTQPRPSTSSRAGATARIDCQFSGSDFQNMDIHWYQQKPGEAPTHILYVLVGDPVIDEQANKELFHADKKASTLISTLTIKRVTKQQEATYYCAFWDDTTTENLCTAYTETSSGLSAPGSQGLKARLVVAGCVLAQALQQTPISITKPESKTVLINCHVSAADFATTFIHWYRKRVNAAPERIAYMSSRLFLENNSDDGKFSIEKDHFQFVCTLTVSKVTPQDAATYYCARWDAQQSKDIGDLYKGKERK